jgi:hypothetical protein
MAKSKPAKVKPAKVRLSKEKGESSNAYKNRVADAERVAFRAAADANAAIDRAWDRSTDNPKNRPTLDTEGPSRRGRDEDAGSNYTTERRGRFGRRSTGHG